MRRHLAFTLLSIAAIACRPGRPQVVYANAEGLVDVGAPPRLRPARQPNALLSQRGTAELVVRVTQTAMSNPRVHVQLFPNDVWRDVVRSDSTGTDGTVRFADLRPGSYSGLARRVGFRQTTFLLTLAAGYADTLELNLGWAGR